MAFQNVKRLERADLVVALAFLLAAVVLLNDTLFGGRVLLPVDNLYRIQPYRSLAAEAGVGVPHNDLISDQILQNYTWRRFAAESVRHGEPPLWNPQTFSGMPFLATGQYGTLYPFGVIFLLIAPERAYAWYTLFHLVFGALATYAFLRVIGGGRVGGLVAGFAFAFSGFIVVSFLWPQFLGTVLWLPFLLTIVELIIRRVAEPPPLSAGKGAGGFSLPVLVAVGGLGVGCQFLGQHFELCFYLLFSLAFYSAARLGFALWQTRRLAPCLRAGAILLAMIAIGTAAAGVQLLPFFEVVTRNFRTANWGSFQEVVGYALPKKQALVYLIPDLFGNPTHHSFFDLFDFATKTVPNSSLGRPTDPPQTIYFGVKNYVEGTGYVGILPLVLAAIAVLTVRRRHTAIFGAYAIFAFLLILGTPLYAIFYFGIPGLQQLHTPFRWVFPYTLSVAVLAGLGAGKVWELAKRTLPAPRPFPMGEGSSGLAGVRLVALAALGAGLAVIGGLAASLVFRDRVAALADAYLRRSPTTAAAFADGQMLYSYEFRNLLIFGVLLSLSGLVVLLALRARTARLFPILAGALVAADLILLLGGFNTHADPALLRVTPPVVQFLAEDKDVFRIASFGPEDVLKPNTGTTFGLHDIRGYDSIIPRQYVEYWSLMEPPEGLPYTAINKLMRPESLTSKYLDLLNAKYVLTTEKLDLPGLRLVYDREVRVYERETVLPRAFLVSDARFVADGEAALAALREPAFDPRRTIVLEGAPPAEPAGYGRGGSVGFVSYRNNEVVLHVRSDGANWLLLADSHYPGWKVTVSDESATLYRADHNFRAVLVPDGEHRVAFKYVPDSIKQGLIVSLLGLSVAALLLGIALWGALTARMNADSSVQRVGRNSAAPMATSLFNKAIDMAFAMLMLRILLPDEVGRWAFVVVVIGYVDILSNFGLNALVIREVARDPAARGRYLGASLVLRLGLLAVAAPIAFAALLLAPDLLVAVGFGRTDVDGSTLLAFGLLAVALIPGNVAATLSSLFYAAERMEYPAALAVITNIVRIALGALVLLAGFGFVGLAAVSLGINLLNAALFAVLCRRVLGVGRPVLRPEMIRPMIVDAFPLMLNHFLATIFFKIDSVLLYNIRGAAAVGYYSTAYKLVDGLQVIPSSFVFALFPLLSRRAGEGTDAIRRAYVVGLRVLVGLAVPISVVTTFFATPLVLVIGGPRYLPDASIALAVLIWFLPFGFANGLTQYVLIAINQQRFITVSFVIATGFNLVTNVLLIPRFGLVAAAGTTVLSELVLMAPFLYCTRNHLGPIPLAAIYARTGLAGLGMSGVLWLGGRDTMTLLAALPVAVAIYGALLIGTGGITRDEIAVGMAFVRARIARRRAARVAAG